VVALEKNIFSIKCAFVGKNNFNIIKMHGTTIIKIYVARYAYEKK
jgi:hypothetical protein